MYVPKTAKSQLIETPRLCSCMTFALWMKNDKHQPALHFELFHCYTVSHDFDKMVDWFYYPLCTPARCVNVNVCINIAQKRSRIIMYHFLSREAKMKVKNACEKILRYN